MIAALFGFLGRPDVMIAMVVIVGLALAWPLPDDGSCSCDDCFERRRDAARHGYAHEASGAPILGDEARWRP